jgi:integrase
LDRLSEVTGLKLKHVNLERGCIHIEQRNWRGDIDSPKTIGSNRTLALGKLVERYRTWIAGLKTTNPEAWVSKARRPQHPLWDSGVRQALKQAAKDENYDFPGFGPHSLRRASITLRQEVGASAIEASKVAGHSKINMTGEYTIVQLKRQDELTRKMQDLRTGMVIGNGADAAADKTAEESAA